jgi:hypothetical protein
MTTEFPFGPFLSNLATQKSEPQNWLVRLNFLEKLPQISKHCRMSLIDRATIRPCDDCSRTIRPWDRRVIAEYTSYHRRCWESRQFFREFVRYQQSQPQTLQFQRATELIESIVLYFYDEVQRNGKDSAQGEYIRGMLNGAKSMLAELSGKAIKEQVVGEVRKRVGKPIPSVLALAEDGNRYGWDLEADPGSP